MKVANILPRALINNMDINSPQVLAEGWDSPLKGFMREETLLETLCFNSILVYSFNLTGNGNHLSSVTDLQNFDTSSFPNFISMSVPSVKLLI